jgi:hypothetical protein
MMPWPQLILELTLLGLYFTKAVRAGYHIMMQQKSLRNFRHSQQQ